MKNRGYALLPILAALSACSRPSPTATLAGDQPTSPTRPTTAPTPLAAVATTSPESAGTGSTVELAVEIGDQFITSQGELAILGVVSNPDLAPARLQLLSLVAIDPNGQPSARANLRYGPSLLMGGERVPFLAVAAHNPGHARWEVVASAATGGTAGTIELLGEPDLRLTPQGAPFVLGQLHNPAGEPQDARLLLTLWQGDRLLSVCGLDTPVALGPGEQLSFSAIDFPGFELRAGGVAAEDLRVEARVESAAASATAEPLALTVEVFHSVGSALFLRGTVTNQQSRSLDLPAVLAEVRSLNGELWTAGWTVMTGSLGPAEQRDFVLELPLEQEIDPALAEFDLRAYGTRASP